MSEEPPYDYTLEMPFHWTTSFNNLDGSPILTIKPTGELVPGPGLSDDEVSKRLAGALAGTFETHIRQSVSQSMADEIERLREALREVVEAWDWWQVDPHDRCSSVPSKAIDAARVALGEGK